MVCVRQDESTRIPLRHQVRSSRMPSWQAQGHQRILVEAIIPKARVLLQHFLGKGR